MVAQSLSTSVILAVRRLNLKTDRSKIMVIGMNFVLTLVLVCTCAIALGDDREVSSVKPKTLERAILDFNEDSDEDREKLGLPRLTESEVLAAIRGTTGMAAENYKLFTEIADSKKLPANAKLVLYRRHFANGFKSSVLNIELSIKKNEKDHAHVSVRHQYLSTEQDIPRLSAVKTPK